MTGPSDLRDFLVSRRGRLTPERAGVALHGGARRVPGLRREEVAFLASVSAEYYTRFEQGKVPGASAEVVDAVCDALQLDEPERDHLHNLLDALRPNARSTSPAPKRVTTGLQLVLDAITVPAFVQNDRLDIVAANTLGRALYPFVDDEPKGLFNSSRFVFLDQRSHEFYRDRRIVVRNNVALLRASAGRNPHDDELMTLIGQLSTQSAEFRELWAAQNVLKYRTGPKRYLHPLVGEIEFDYETFTMPAYPGLTMLVYNVEPNSPTAEAMQLLGNWTTIAPGVAATNVPVSERPPTQ